MIFKSLLVLAFVALISAEVDLRVHQCLNMAVENTADGLVSFSVSFAKQEYSAELIPVLGFESYNDGLLEQRGSCSNVASGTTASNVASTATGGYNGIVTQNGWVRSVQDDVVTFTLVKSLEELSACRDFENQRVLSQFSGTFYIALVQIVQDDTHLVDYARYIQPHEFTLSAEGTVQSVTGMQFRFDLEWIGNTWLPSGDALIELHSRVTPTGRPAGHFENAEIVTESGDPAELMLISECDASTRSVCVQSWFIRSTGQPGTYRITAQLVEDTGPSLLMTAGMNVELQDGEIARDQTGVQGMIFRDEQMTLPYLASNLNFSSIVDGGTVCMMLQDNSGNNIVARAARICTSLDMDLHASESAMSGCNTPEATNVIEASIFDHDKNERSSTFNPVMKATSRGSQQAFCFTAKKLSDRSHVLEMEYYTEGDEQGQLGKRNLLSFEWDDRSRCPRDVWIDCPQDCDWNRGHSSCQQKHTDDTFSSGGVWLWGLLIFFLIIVCILAFGCTGYGSDGYYHPGTFSWWGSGTSTSTNQTQLQKHQNSHNTYNTHVHRGGDTTQTYQSYQDNDKYDVDDVDPLELEELLRRRGKAGEEPQDPRTY